MKRWVTIAVCGVVTVGVLGWSGLRSYRFLAERGYIKINEYDIRTEGILQVGDYAPDLSLALVEGKETRLSELWAEKPLVLVFGSYT